jgi:hypothetical protein
MGKLAIGNNLISIETATKQVIRNIQELMQKKAQLTHGVSGNTRAIAFYEERIAAQKVLLIWLRKAL